jgi:drug/metabolite transporter (DMT)-like permease
VLDISANALFAVAATEGLVSLVAVLASLYPIVTIVLARFLLRERIHRSQQAGVAGALAGVALITVG